MTTLADDIATVLRRHGVGRIFGIPGGGSSLDLIDAAGRAGIPFVLARTEAAATIMAAVTGELSGAPGAVLVGVGPGAASAVNGIAYADLERAPLVLFMDGPASSRHQHFDQRAVFAPLGRATARLRPADGGSVLDRLLDLATTPPEGPVVVELTAGDAATATTGEIDSTPRAAAGMDPDALTRARDLLGAGKRPFLLIGLEARQSAQAVRAFGAALGAPVMTTYKGAGVIACDDAAFVAPFTGAAAEMPLLAGADLIVGIGLDAIECIPGTWPETLAPVLMLGGTRTDNPRIPSAHAVAGPLADILATLEPRRSAWDAAEIAALRDRARTVYAPRGRAFSAAHAVTVLAQSVSAETRLSVDAGAHMFSALGLWPARHPFGVLKSNGLSTMGYALPAAIASKLAEPDRPVLALTGDGGLAMCLGELATAADLKLDISVLVMNDAALSLIDIKQQRQQRPSRGVRYPALDFAAIARGFGWHAETVADADALGAALSSRIGGPRLIDARIDPSGYGDELARLRG